MISVIHLVVIVMGMVVVVKIIVVFDVGMSVPHVIVVRSSVRMGTRQELWVNMMGPLWK